MVSLGVRGVLRLHRGYAFAPDAVLRAIVRFLDPRLPRSAAAPGRARVPGLSGRAACPGAARNRPARAAASRATCSLLHRLGPGPRAVQPRALRAGCWGACPIRLSGRMRTRLGELSVDLRTGRPMEIAISRRHIARHPWAEVEHTLLHEMVHQWQAETGLPVDHGAAFRRKAATGRRPPGSETEPRCLSPTIAVDASRAAAPPSERLEAQTEAEPKPEPLQRDPITLAISQHGQRPARRVLEVAAGDRLPSRDPRFA